jgi:hypothetical protein
MILSTKAGDNETGHDERNRKNQMPGNWNSSLGIHFGHLFPFWFADATLIHPAAHSADQLGARI